MKAVVCASWGEPAALQISDAPVPEPGPGQVQIRVRAASLNFPDALMVQGRYQIKPPLPFVPGAEFAGDVSKVGQGVSALSVGDRVIATGLGGFGEVAVADVARVMPLPAGMDYADGAAFVLTYATSLHALADCGHLQPGETLLVLGAGGGVGTAALEIGKAMGARVIAAASSQAKRDLCTRLGADAVVDYTREDWRDAVTAIVGKKGVDVVYDPVGGPYTEPALRCLAWRGRLLVVGFAAGEIPRPPLNLALLRERAIVGVFWGESVRMEPEEHARNMRRLAEWFRAGRIRPAITERIGLASVPDALTRMLARGVAGKVVVLPEG